MDYFEKANELYNTKDYKNAIDMYKKAVESKNNESTSLYNAAVCHIKLKEFEEAIPLLKLAIALKNDSKYFYNLAYCYAMIKNNAKALLYFNTAWSLNNDDTDCEKAINLITKNLRKIS